MSAMSSYDSRDSSRTRQARPSDESMAALRDAIARLNADGEFVAQALTQSIQAQRPVSIEDRLTPQEADYLVRSGAFTPEEFEETSKRVARGDLPVGVASTLLASLHQSMTADSVAQFLKLDPSVLEQAVANGELYAVDVAGQTRFPSWQFSLSTPGKLLPHLTEIIALVKEKNWISVSGLMATPQSTLVTEGPQTPVEWFRGGGEIDALRRIIEGQKWP